MHLHALSALGLLTLGAHGKPVARIAGGRTLANLDTAPGVDVAQVRKVLGENATVDCTTFTRGHRDTDLKEAIDSFFESYDWKGIYFGTGECLHSDHKGIKLKACNMNDQTSKMRSGARQGFELLGSHCTEGADAGVVGLGNLKTDDGWLLTLGRSSKALASAFHASNTKATAALSKRDSEKPTITKRDDAERWDVDVTEPLFTNHPAHDQLICDDTEEVTGCWERPCDPPAWVVDEDCGFFQKGWDGCEFYCEQRTLRYYSEPVQLDWTDFCTGTDCSISEGETITSSKTHGISATGGGIFGAAPWVAIFQIGYTHTWGESKGTTKSQGNNFAGRAGMCGNWFQVEEMRLSCGTLSRWRDPNWNACECCTDEDHVMSSQQCSESTVAKESGEPLIHLVPRWADCETKEYLADHLRSEQWRHYVVTVRADPNSDHCSKFYETGNRDDVPKVDKRPAIPPEDLVDLDDDQGVSCPEYAYDTDRKMERCREKVQICWETKQCDKGNPYSRQHPPPPPPSTESHYPPSSESTAPPPEAT